jgi:hypothetical protein
MHLLAGGGAWKVGYEPVSSGTLVVGEHRMSEAVLVAFGYGQARPGGDDVGNDDLALALVRQAHDE